MYVDQTWGQSNPFPVLDLNPNLNKLPDGEGDPFVGGSCGHNRLSSHGHTRNPRAAVVWCPLFF